MKGRDYLIAREYRQGETLREIGARYGLSHERIRQILEAEGIELRRRGVSSRRKGVRGEREVARIFEAAGFEVRGLEATGDQLVVCKDGLLLHSEVKRQERLRLPEWIAQARAEAPRGTVPVVVFRQSRGEWYATLTLDALVGIVQ